MAIVPPTGNASRTLVFGDANNVGAAGQHMVVNVGRMNTALGKVPTLYFHPALADGISTVGGTYKPAFDAIACVDSPTLAPELGGGTQWATDDVVGAGGYADTALAWAATPPTVSGTGLGDAVVTGIGVRADKLAVHGWSMGSLNGLNWAWRNVGKVRAVVLVGPIVDFEKFYNDNPVFQSPIDTDWGTHGAWLAALPNTDPMRNLDRIRPFGHRIQLWYAESDEYIDPADVRAFAELVGAEAHAFPGTHTDLVNVPPDQVALFTARKIRERASFYVGWDSTDWGRAEHVVVNYDGSPPNNVHTLDTQVYSGGRRGRVTRVSGSKGNERHVQLFNELLAPDVSVRTIWHGMNGGAMRGQQGNVMRAITDPVANTYALYIFWHNVLFGVPWIVNASRWTGTIGSTLVQNGSTNKTIEGLRRASGGYVLASERQGGIVTLVVHQADADRAYRSGVLDVTFDGVGISNYSGTVQRVDANHLSFPQAGGDVISGGTGVWADFASCFPYVADTELYGTSMRGRFYVPGMDPPAWDDPDWTHTWVDPGGGHTDYGSAGVFYGHVGLFDPSVSGIFVEFGPELVVTEL